MILTKHTEATEMGSKQEWKDLHAALWEDYCADMDKKEALIKELQATIREMERSIHAGGVALGDTWALHVEGVVTEINEHYFTVQPTEGTFWSVEFGDPDWSKLKAAPIQEAPAPPSGNPCGQGISSSRRWLDDILGELRTTNADKK